MENPGFACVSHALLPILLFLSLLNQLPKQSTQAAFCLSTPTRTTLSMTTAVCESTTVSQLFPHTLLRFAFICFCLICASFKFVTAGTNVVYKSPPYIPITDHFDAHLSFSAQDIVYLRQWGVRVLFTPASSEFLRFSSNEHTNLSLRPLQVNAVRLGVMWPGVEPTRGNYNQTYLSLMKQIVHNCSQAGIGVLIDFHQDDFSEKVKLRCPFLKFHPRCWLFPPYFLFSLSLSFAPVLR